jgi:predicted transcriptional regulator of viral defense system
MLTQSKFVSKMSVVIDKYRRFPEGSMVRITKLERVLEYVRRTGIVRPRDLALLEVPQDYLWRLHKRGLLERTGRGLYAFPEADVTEHHSLAEVCKRVPHGVICLLSALRFHEITTQSPFEVWVAVDVKARAPRAGGPALRLVRFSGRALSEGVQEQTIEGVRVRVFTPAKTVADCFKYRNKIGRDIAVEALRECLSHRRATADEIWRYAKICRVTEVIRPYLEAMV